MRNSKSAPQIMKMAIDWSKNWAQDLLCIKNINSRGDMKRILMTLKF